MNALDPGGEWLRITEHYRHLSDGELLALGRQQSELTDFAQQALAYELHNRGLKVEVEDENPPENFTPPPAFFEHESPKLKDSASYEGPNPDTAYKEDRKLVELCTVWSVRDALQVQEILDRAGIPFFMGKEKATGVDAVTSNFAEGVSVQIMQIGLAWAGPAMRHYEPKDDPTPKQEVVDELPMRCPRCHSEEVVFEGLAVNEASEDQESGDTAVDDPATENSSGAGSSNGSSSSEPSASIFKWTCDSCGHQWQDDGVVKEE